MHVTYSQGIYLPGPDIWLDPHTTKAFAVVTHAHSDHVRGHRRVLSSHPTAAMMRHRGAQRSEFQSVHFNEPFFWNDARITLLPAGHILGSAQVLVEWQGTRLLYSGDFKMRPGLSCESIEIPQADILIMETTFGRPRYSFPPRDQVMEEIITFCTMALDAGETPVLFCYSLGKGQEVLAGLREASFPIYLHHDHYQMAEIYRQHEVNLPAYRLHRIGEEMDGVLLCASSCRRSAWFDELPRPRTAYISGWAADQNARWRFNADEAFALSDHADYAELLDYVHRTGAHTIYTTHGFDHAFARDLRNKGLNARPLRKKAAEKKEAAPAAKPSKQCRLTMALPF